MVVDLLLRATVVVSSRPDVMVAALVDHKDRVDLTSHLTYFQYDHMSLSWDRLNLTPLDNLVVVEVVYGCRLSVVMTRGCDG